MIGNDIIDLVQSRKESNWRRRGFVSKLFDEQEQLLIVNSPDPEIVVWLLWSMKEAAYKIWNRQTGIRKYIPLKLRCSVHKRSSCKARGEVICEGKRYYTKTIVSPDFIHTIAAGELVHLDDIVEIKRDGIIKDSLGVPSLVLRDGKRRLPVSVSNHGRFERIVSIHSLLT
ncbi:MULTISPECIES: 4'-phosphopantetheinyl transferase family protein [Sphingobacterium]|jgi:phosphopantetheinyl transferase (holo-ACP synthase)|uniref:4'-phosphopantetheinyl transferase superfamily n=1 Tax=Sphingobacterium multivorum TaxID=28454 RepID=A0A654DDA9_SPHMU|nr:MULTISPECIES: 4'-phosphopantetheinyl transferase superfamily protein [Sphingobacterium]HAE67560.1 phosphopantetheinyl transferase [Sphingobacterium sp.]QQT45291.1 4-phosphopantetheinyl transferase family protein [Sphingobacterium multivorum]QQT62071.1 4-phosphopantetheinyl transferase family protein [Sphingobacterium multivorum]SUJ22939.1 4'-phosphopantetheinyl transferase superfamily [Sphingobacterium multivorum]VXD03532.1 4'-phosphopantetheinyl transferase superfamily [Sphingobacterium mu